jgi:ABC-type Fe3+-hydroxamate transport system substrate-binding protein
MRVVSLVPSVTETLLAWGVTPVAVTRFCEQPSRRAVGGTKDPDLGAIVDLAPDLVVMCHEENRLEDHDALRAAGVRVESLRIESVADVEVAMAELAAVVGAPTPEPFVPPAPIEERRTAFVPIWRRPWMTLAADTYGASLLASLGVDVVTPEADDRYPQMDLAEAASRAPDLVLAPSEPYPFAGRHVAELEAVAPVVLVDGQDLFWWGVRTPGASTRLRAVLTSLEQAGTG